MKLKKMFDKTFFKKTKNILINKKEKTFEPKKIEREKSQGTLHCQRKKPSRFLMCFVENEKRFMMNCKKI